MSTMNTQTENAQSTPNTDENTPLFDRTSAAQAILAGVAQYRYSIKQVSRAIDRRASKALDVECKALEEAMKAAIQ